jgi:hypothetical protein
MDWYYSKFTNPEYTIHDLIEEANKVVARHEILTTYISTRLKLAPSAKAVFASRYSRGFDANDFF